MFMRTSIWNVSLCSVLVFAAACPSAQELKEAFDEDDAGVKDDEDAPARAGRGGSGRAGKGGSLSGSAGKGAAGSAAMLEDDQEDGPEGAAGSASPGSFGSAGSAAAAGRGGSPAAGSGGAGAAIGGRAGSGAAGRGTIGGGQAGGAAAGSGAAGSGTLESDSIFLGTTKLAALTTDNQAEALCDLLRARIKPSDLDSIERGSCTLEGLTGELQGQGECTTLVQECSSAPVSVDLEENCVAADVPRCTNVTVDEYVACSIASIESSAAFFGRLTCSTDLTTISDLPTPAACVGPYQRCPELTSGSEDSGT